MPESISLLLWQNEVEAACQLRGHKRVVEDSLSGASASRNALIWLFGKWLRQTLLVSQNFGNGKQKKKGEKDRDRKITSRRWKSLPSFQRTRHWTSQVKDLCLWAAALEWHIGGREISRLGRGPRMGRRPAWGHVMWVTRPNDILWIRRPEVSGFPLWMSSAISHFLPLCTWAIRNTTW